MTTIDVAFHRRHGDALVLEASADDDVGALERVGTGGVPQPHDEVRADLRELQRRAGSDRLLDVGDGRDRLPVDVDGLGRILGLGERLGEDDHDGL